jgi:predicted N-acetyltransferase YhbS
VKVNIIRKSEFEISELEHEQISKIREICFSDCHCNRSYFKQLPHFRYLAIHEHNVVGMVGIDHRMISVGGKPVSIFGVIDLCVLPEFRKHGIGASLMKEAEQLAQESSIDFIVLLADNHSLYKRLGFEVQDNDCTWLRIDEFKNHGIAEENLGNELMVKAVGDAGWPEGAVDFLGYLF